MLTAVCSSSPSSQQGQTAEGQYGHGCRLGGGLNRQVGLHVVGGQTAEGVNVAGDRDQIHDRGVLGPHVVLFACGQRVGEDSDRQDVRSGRIERELLFDNVYAKAEDLQRYPVGVVRVLPSSIVVSWHLTIVKLGSYIRKDCDLSRRCRKHS